MRTVETLATIGPDGTLTARVPSDVPPGEHRVTLIIDETALDQPEDPLADFPVISVGVWPEELSLRREDLYGDFGR